MQNIQSMVFKIMLILLLSTATFSSTAKSQDYPQQMINADSLFAQKKYTQSYILYDSIYNIGKLSSPSMLLKMAYIREGLGDYTMALYFLYDYYIQTSDELALEKMESLASAKSLSGYEYSDKEYFLSVYHDYYNEILILLGAISILFFAGVVYQKFRHHRKPVSNYVLLAIFSLALLYVLNVGMGFQEAIVIHQNTYVMDSPSSAGNVIDIIGKGHKIIIDGSKDVWYKINWNDQEVFVKKKNVLPVKSW